MTTRGRSSSISRASTARPGDRPGPVPGAIMAATLAATMTGERKKTLRRELEAIVGRGAVLSDPEELLVYESDGLTLFRALADFVVFPTSAEHVSAIVKLANREGLPFVARGAGTGLSGGCLPAEGGIVISLMRMNRVLEVGSEGTFGVATKICVRILKKPQAVKTVLGVFDRVEQASAAVSAIIARGLVPAAVEMIDQLTIAAVEDAFGCGYPRDAAAALLVELDGLAVGMDAQVGHIIEACRDSGAREVRTARDETERQLLWKGRKSAFGAYGRVSPAYMVMDGVIPRTKLPYVLSRVNEIVAGHGLRVGNVFHAGDGNLHPNILYDPRKPGEEARVVEAGAEIMRLCAEVGGSISGEHGIGLEKADFMPFIFSAADLEFMRRLKHAFNPTGRCNPGKVFPTRKSCGEAGPVAYRPHPIEEKGLAQRF